jgi:ATP-dependent DNA ligase
VAWASSTEEKRELLRQIRARNGEGVVMRDKMAGYPGKRSTAWMRWRDRLAEIDAVVIDYKEGTGKYEGTVGGVLVGLYDGINLRPIGWAGSGWSDVERDELLGRWQAGQNNYVVTIQTFGLNFGDQVIRPSGIRIRPLGDKRPGECTFDSEVGRPFGAYRTK